MQIDQTTEFGQRAVRRLTNEEVIWFTTVDPQGMPQPTPVWFIWDGAAIWFFSQPRTAKLRNIKQHSQVSLNFNSDAYGNDVVVLTGTAELVDEMPSELLARFLEKYKRGLASLNMSGDAFKNDYSQVVKITPSKLRGF